MGISIIYKYLNGYRAYLPIFIVYIWFNCVIFQFSLWPEVADVTPNAGEYCKVQLREMNTR